MKRIIKYFSIVIVLIVLFIGSTNLYMYASTKNQIIDESSNLKNYDCILILGAGVKKGSPTIMLSDRLLQGVYLYKTNASNKLLMSGDHGSVNYDEVNVMKKYAKNMNVPSEDIFMDHAGFSTYDSLYRAKYVFNVKKVIIISQDYHLYRALYIANSLGIEAIGVSATKQKYNGQAIREVREVIARTKDFVKCIIKPKSKYLGEVIPISGNGDLTND